MLSLPYSPGEWEDDARPLRGPRRHSDRCIVARPATTWHEACRVLSTLAGGQWRPKDSGLVWSMGRQVLWVVAPHALESVEAARCVAMPWVDDPGWSIGSVSRGLLAALGEGQPAANSDHHLWQDASIGLRVCRPCIAQEGTIYDASAYYYSIMRRLPSLTCLPLADGKCSWFRQTRSEAVLRNAIMDAIGTHKLLRNAVWGSMVGSTTPGPYYHRGELRTGFAMKGKFRPSGEMLARAAYELTLMVAYEVDSVYTHTDCVTSIGGLYPSIWEANGYSFREHYSGYTHINNCCSVKCGPHESKLYDPIDYVQQTIELPSLPRHLYGRGWAFAA